MRKREEAGLQSALSRVEIYVTILGTVLGLLLTWSQLRIARSEEMRAQRTEPLSYTLQTEDTHYVYEITLEGRSRTVPAPSLRLQVTHGSLHSITAISFDGTIFHQMERLPIQDSWRSCLVDITMPPQAVLTEGELVCDYFFLYLEPTAGQGQLDLICNTISLSDGTVASQVLHRIDLAELEYLPQGAQREMLEVYSLLFDELKALGLLD